MYLLGLCFRQPAYKGQQMRGGSTAKFGTAETSYPRTSSKSLESLSMVLWQRLCGGQCRPQHSYPNHCLSAKDHIFKHFILLCSTLATTVRRTAQSRSFSTSTSATSGYRTRTCAPPSPAMRTLSPPTPCPSGPAGCLHKVGSKTPCTVLKQSRLSTSVTCAAQRPEDQVYR